MIITGGPNSVYEVNAPMVDFDIFNGQLPVLGICYGFQVNFINFIIIDLDNLFKLINKFFGGTVSSQKLREDGQTTIEIENGCALFTGLDSTQRVLLQVFSFFETSINYVLLI